MNTDARDCTHPNCERHGKSPCEGIGCDGSEDPALYPPEETSMASLDSGSSRAVMRRDASRPRPYILGSGRGRRDADGHTWFATDPYPTWWRTDEHGQPLTRRDYGPDRPGVRDYASRDFGGEHASWVDPHPATLDAVRPESGNGPFQFRALLSCTSGPDATCTYCRARGRTFPVEHPNGHFGTPEEAADYGRSMTHNVYGSEHEVLIEARPIPSWTRVATPAAPRRDGVST